MNVVKYFSVALLIGLAGISCSKERKNPYKLNAETARIDDILSTSVFEGVDGHEVKISDFKGKVVVVDFWETWCGPCLMVFPAMDSLKTLYNNDFEIIAVNTLNSDSEDDVKEFIGHNNLKFNFVLDKNRVGEEVISLGIPFKVFIDPDGYVIKAEAGSYGTQSDFNKAKEIIEEYKSSK